MNPPDSLPTLKEAITRLVTSPNKGAYYVVGIDKDTNKPYLWLKHTAPFSRDELTAAKNGSTGPYTTGALWYDTSDQTLVFVGGTQPPSQFSTWIATLCKIAGSERLKDASYVKVGSNEVANVANNGAKAAIVRPKSTVTPAPTTPPTTPPPAPPPPPPTPKPTATEAPLAARKDKLEKAQAALAKAIKDEAATLRAYPTFRDALLAASEAGATLRGDSPNLDEVQTLLTKGTAALETARKAHTAPPKPLDPPPVAPPLPPPPTPRPTATVKDGYDPGNGAYAGRPDKPKSLSGQKDEAGDPLTAHHLYPWNRLRDQLNLALEDKSGNRMRALFKFASHTPEADFFNQLALPYDKRDPAFVQMVNRAALAICWGPANIMMGPLNTKRGDDPGHDLDMAYSKSGLPTPASAVAELMEKSGGAGTPSKLAELLAERVREAHTDEDGNIQARPYDPLEWEDNGKGERVRRKVVPIRPEGGKLSPEEDPNWTPAEVYVPKEKEKAPTLSEEEQQEQLQQKIEAGKKKKAEELLKKTSTTDDEDDDPGFSDMFNSGD